MKALLERLFARELLNEADARAALHRVTSEKIPAAQKAAFMTVFNMRPLAPEELRGFANGMLDLALPFDLEGRETIDIVGTGGDGKNTFNISTLSCVVVAGAGYPVTKHGSYGVSSASGSSDTLIALGYEFTNDTDELRRRLDRAGICFLHAPLFHPAMKAVVPVRKDLRVRTFFNILGPLANPAQPKYQLFGTYGRGLSRLYHYLTQEDPTRDCTIVHALDGYDEISLTAGAEVRYSRGGTALLYPAHFDLPRLEAASLHGGAGPEDARRIFLSVLDNRASAAQQDVVCANAGLAIHTIKPQVSLPDCVAEARVSIESGAARRVLERML